NDKIAYATERCLAEQCGAEPWGLPRLGFVDDIGQLTPESLYAVWRNMVENAAVHLYVVGPHELSAVLQVAQDLFSLRGNPAMGLRIEPAATVGATAREVVEEMEVGQGKLHIGLRTGLGLASDLYPALLVYNGILGGFAHSKLFLNVREKASLAYYASSRLDALKGLLMISSGIDISNFAQARDIIGQQLAHMRAGEISEQELQFTQDALITRYLQSDDQPLAGATLQMYSRLTGRDRTPQDLIDGIRRVGKEDVVAVAQGVAEDVVYFLRDKEGVA
ncbi:MAG: insulinase family protein, partial [Firmicutes bacterium]|nr:insulinase family protein [Bacillota bacterium]